MFFIYRIEQQLLSVKPHDFWFRSSVLKRLSAVEKVQVLSTDLKNRLSSLFVIPFIAFNNLVSFCFLIASCFGYPIPNGPSNNLSNVHCKLISPAHPKFNPRGNEIALPLLILPNKYASDGFSTYPHKTPGKLLHASNIYSF